MGENRAFLKSLKNPKKKKNPKETAVKVRAVRVLAVIHNRRVWGIARKAHKFVVEVFGVLALGMSYQRPRHAMDGTTIVTGRSTRVSHNKGKIAA
jgi:hypothetical protein